jgi:hypothetical protein
MRMKAALEEHPSTNLGFEDRRKGERFSPLN